ncbi:MAG: ABC transporter permease subunit [Pseudonocardiaceae bacterium]|nr:ABC transporter permease subunit [Pseudonocardiaceae bacterium]
MSGVPTLQDWIPNLLRGLELTVLLTVLGSILMLLLSVVLGLAARSQRRWLRGSARTVIEFFRGTSLLVQLFWLFYALPQLGIRFEPLLVGVLALGLNYGAYGSEVVRGSLNAVPAAQWEAATALNMSPWQRMRRVIWPQAVVLMLPPFNNLLIQLLKGTPLVIAISLVDLFAVGEAFRTGGGNVYLMYLVVLPAIYLALAYTMTFGMNLLEAAAKARLGQGRGLRDAFANLRPGAVVKT